MATIEKQIAVVLGGAKGIGLAISQRLAAEGAVTWFTSRREEELEAAKSKISGTVMPLRADVSQKNELSRIMQTISDKSGHIDILIINAGMSEYATLGKVRISGEILLG